jgi:hypothetical protein
MIDGEGGVGASEVAKKMAFESLDESFGLVRSLLVGGDVVVFEVSGSEEVEKGDGLLVAEHLDLEFVAMRAEELVDSKIGGTELGRDTGSEGLNLAAAFVDGQKEVLGAIFDKNGELLGEVGVDGITPEFGRGS